MKTVLVVYSGKEKLPKKEIRRMKQYAFNTAADLKAGDRIESEEYDTPMVVAEVFDKKFTYYNMATGDLSDDRPANTNIRPIRELVIGEPDTDTVYAVRL
jgi:hypothetical protein